MKRGKTDYGYLLIRAEAEMAGSELAWLRYDKTYLRKAVSESTTILTYFSFVAELRRYYNESEYRFEVPADALTEVQALLEDCFVELTVVD